MKHKTLAFALTAMCLLTIPGCGSKEAPAPTEEVIQPVASEQNPTSSESAPTTQSAENATPSISQDPAAPLDVSSIPTPPPASERANVPDFRLPDAAGNEVALSDFRGKIVILNFWASWCEDCKEEIPEIQALSDELKSSKDVVLITVDLADGQKETVESAKQYMSENNLTFTTLFDTTGTIATEYSLTNIPTTIIVDANGKFVARHESATTKDEILQVVANVPK